MTRKLSIFLTLVLGQIAVAQTAHVDHAGLKKLGWQLACQMGTFKDRTVFETLEFLHAQNFHHVELWPGQVMSKEKPDVKIGPGMSDADITALQAKLKEVHLDIVSYGPVEAAELRASMELAKKVKAKNVVVRGSLPGDAEKLAEEFGVNVAALGTSDLPEGKRVGVCLDVGNGETSTQRVIEVHIGKSDASEVLAKLKEEKFKGVFAVEIKDGGMGKDLDERFISAVNAFSDEVTKLAK